MTKKPHIYLQDGWWRVRPYGANKMEYTKAFEWAMKMNKAHWKL